MLTAIIGLSLNILALVLFILSAKFWLPMWINNNGRSGTAHALFLTNSTLAIAVLFKIIQTVCKLFLGDTSEDQTFNIVIALLVLFVSVYQLALTRGYFNIKE